MGMDMRHVPRRSASRIILIHRVRYGWHATADVLLKGFIGTSVAGMIVKHLGADR
jgi:hypothetical protein